MKEIKVSVVLISYNQEAYIKEAIKSILNQKVNFNYELILADDCSKDKTFQIMEEYAKKYPEKIVLLKRKQNLGATKNQLDASLHAKGKYLTVLEGDDYWSNENKLQTQVDFLENHPEYIGISHYREGRNQNNEIVGNFPSEVKETCDISMEDWARGKLKFPETATLYHNIYLDKEHVKNLEYLFSVHPVISDTQLCLYLLSLGKVRMLAEPWMVYRIRHQKGESNFNSTHKIYQIQMGYLDIYNAVDQFFHEKYNFYVKFKSSVTLGVVSALLSGDVKSAAVFIKKCPKKYKVKIILLLPFNAIKILFKKLRRR